MVKNPPVSAGDRGDAGSIPGWGSSPGVGNGNLLQYSCLDSMDGGAWWATVHRVTNSQTWLSTHSHTPDHRLPLVTSRFVHYNIFLAFLGSGIGVVHTWHPQQHCCVPQKRHKQPVSHCADTVSENLSTCCQQSTFDPGMTPVCQSVPVSWSVWNNMSRLTEDFP